MPHHRSDAESVENDGRTFPRDSRLPADPSAGDDRSPTSPPDRPPARDRTDDGGIGVSLPRRIARRFGFAVFAAYAVVSVLFALVTFAPNPQLAVLLDRQASTAAEAREIRREFRQARGLDEPLLNRYLDWLIDVPTLDWGQSYGTMGLSSVQYGPRYEAGVEVTSLVADALVPTLRYVVPAVIFAVAGGLAIGLYAATHREGLLARLVTTLTHFGFSVPNFLLAEVLLLFVFSETGLLQGLAPEPGSLLVTTVLPAAIVGTSLLAGQMRYARAQSLEYANTEFIRLVRAKGAGSRRVARHLLRNAAIPLLALFFTDMIGILVVNVFVIEFVFGIPGIGGLSLVAFQQQDLPVILGSTMVIVFVGIGGNFLQDVAALVLDPRIES